MKRPLSTLFAVAVVALSAVTAHAQSGKPNILVIMTDDVGIWNISAYNRGMMGGRTPNIDQIANEGALSPITTRNNPARRVAPPSFSARTLSVRAC
jgi:hypothetical protein